MERREQIRVLKEIIQRLDEGTNVDAGGIRHNPTWVYTCPELAETFGAPERELKQSSARAMLAIGGPRAEDALVELAQGDDYGTRKYAALILIASRGPDHPAVRRIAEGAPSPEVRKLLDHGLEFGHAHQD